MSPSTILWYFADPMCSWCWGFSSIIERIRSTYDEQLKMALMLGGLRPGTTEPLSVKMREGILHHWHEVHKMTGQSFTFASALPEGFIYDTEPASRAVITVAELEPDKIFPYFKSLQSAFYIDQVDVTQAENLAQLARQQAILPDYFLEHFHSEAVRQKTQQHFQGTRQAGVTGFPTLVLQEDERFQFIAKGYRPFDEITAQIDNWLA